MKFSSIGIQFSPSHADVSNLVPMIDQLVQIAAKKSIPHLYSYPELPGIHGIQSVSENELADKCDLIISIGGDGTLLRVAKNTANRGKLLWGVHTGRLGYLTDITPDEFESSLNQIIEENFEINSVEMIKTEVTSSNSQELLLSELALNEFVIEAGSGGQMITIDLEIDGENMSRIDGNGVIVATPAGSTAYNLAAGGPILLSGSNALIVNPICPHTLSNRPAILSFDSVIKIRPLAGESWTQLVGDGQVLMDQLPSGSEIVIERADISVRFVKTSKRSQFDILREKLGWGNPRDN